MRWENLTIGGADDAAGAAQLPGYRDPATVRTFDAPEALRTRFYEVRCKSALNRVPERSAMPFRWTINPYRGCTHSCVYCLGPDTPVLMGDGRHQRIADLRPGDVIYGTSMRGSYRRYVRTTVVAKWNTTKPAYRIALEDGTELVASGDHRFLSDRGWKFVMGAEHGAHRRPHLTLQNRLVGTGAFAEAPRHDEAYRRGYLTGMIRGDGTIGHDDHPRRNGRPRTRHTFRLAPIDESALRRSAEYLQSLVGPLPLLAFPSTGKPAQMIGTSAQGRVDAIDELTTWPAAPCDSWRRGFLAGIFDAEGHRAGPTLRIANSDQEILTRTLEALTTFGFDAVLERGSGGRPVCNVRVRGGLREHLRFAHSVDPAIRRRIDLEGQALKAPPRLGVVSIEPLGPQRLCDITTGTGDFIANGVVSHNCFARPTHTYLGFNAAEDFDQEIVVKANLPEVLRAELRRPSWAREHVALGTNTDPYQWVESKYRLMPDVWAALRDAETPSSVLTKSPLLLRDLDLFRELVDGPGFMASLSIPTMEPKAWRATEPRTPHPQARMEAVAALNAAGIPTSILIAPLMPGINDDPRQVEAILAAAAEAGATNAGGIALHLRGEVRGVFMDWLRSVRPDLVARYEALYARGAYAPEAERIRLSQLITRGRLAHPGAFGGADLFRSRNPDGSLRPENPGALRFGDRPATGRQAPFVRPAPERTPGGSRGPGAAAATGPAGERKRPGPPIQGVLF